jgi:pimeloyl-ACP methyl ester carboxylesterase
VPQWTEEVFFGLSVPKSAMPPGGWPVVQYSHGTGGDRFSFVGDIAPQMAKLGIAVISIDQPLHGKRGGGGLSPANLEFYSFNFSNPSAARNLFRQSALDSVAVTRLLRTQTLDAEGKTVAFDPGRVAFFGHSQGGITGALYVAVDGDTRAAVLSGAGGGLAYTILLRKEVDSGFNLDIKAALEAMLGLKFEDEFTLFHPVLTLCQMLVDVTDPINYSPFYFHPRFRQEPLHLLLTEGVEDPYTPAVTTENLAIAGLVPPMFPVVHGNPGFVAAAVGAAKLPVSNNLQLPDGKAATALLAQFEGFGHFVAFQSPECQALWISFLATGLKQSTPVIKQ